MIAVILTNNEEKYKSDYSIHTIPTGNQIWIPEPTHTCSTQRLQKTLWMICEKLVRLTIRRIFR